MDKFAPSSRYPYFHALCMTVPHSIHPPLSPGLIFYFREDFPPKLRWKLHVVIVCSPAYIKTATQTDEKKTTTGRENLLHRCLKDRVGTKKSLDRIIIICNIHRSRRFTNFFNDAASLPISSTITLNILLWNIANPTTGGLINQLEAPIHTYLGSPSQFQQVMRRITGKKGTIAPKWGTYSLIIVMHPSIDFRSAVLQDGFYSFLANLLRR